MRFKFQKIMKEKNINMGWLAETTEIPYVRLVDIINNDVDNVQLQDLQSILRALETTLADAIDLS